MIFMYNHKIMEIILCLCAKKSLMMNVFVILFVSEMINFTFYMMKVRKNFKKRNFFFRDDRSDHHFFLLRMSNLTIILIR